MTWDRFYGKRLANGLDLMGFSIVSDKDVSVCGLDNQHALARAKGTLPKAAYTT